MQTVKVSYGLAGASGVLADNPGEVGRVEPAAETSRDPPAG